LIHTVILRIDLISLTGFNTIFDYLIVA